MITSIPIGSSNGVTMTSAPAARADLRAAFMSVTRYPVRSAPKGYGMGVVNPKTEIVQTGVKINCEKVLLGVGVTVVATFLDVVPPKVASTLATNRSNWSGAT